MKNLHICIILSIIFIPIVWGISRTINYDPESGALMLTPNVIVTADGRVGIGTTTPDYGVEIEGSIKAEDYFAGNGRQGDTVNYNVIIQGGGVMTLEFVDGLLVIPLP